MQTETASELPVRKVHGGHAIALGFREALATAYDTDEYHKVAQHNHAPETMAALMVEALLRTLRKNDKHPILELNPVLGSVVKRLYGINSTDELRKVYRARLYPSETEG